jgi:hypothetical protein
MISQKLEELLLGGRMPSRFLSRVLDVVVRPKPLVVFNKKVY